MKINIKKLIKEEVAAAVAQQPTTTKTDTTTPEQSTKFGTFNLSALKTLVQLDNETYFTQAMMKIKNNQSTKLSMQEKTEIISFFTKVLQLDDSSKTKVFNLLRQNTKVTK